MWDTHTHTPFYTGSCPLRWSPEFASWTSELRLYLHVLIICMQSFITPRQRYHKVHQRNCTSTWLFMLGLWRILFSWKHKCFHPYVRSAACMPCVCVCVMERKKKVGGRGGGTTSATTIYAKKIGNILFRTRFFLFTNFQKKDLKVIQGHTHCPSINYTGFD